MVFFNLMKLFRLSFLGGSQKVRRIVQHRCNNTEDVLCVSVVLLFIYEKKVFADQTMWKRCFDFKLTNLKPIWWLNTCHQHWLDSIEMKMYRIYCILSSTRLSRFTWPQLIKTSKKAWAIYCSSQIQMLRHEMWDKASKIWGNVWAKRGERSSIQVCIINWKFSIPM